MWVLGKSQRKWRLQVGQQQLLPLRFVWRCAAMTGPYFQQNWPALSYQGETYDLGHLDEYTFSVIDSNGVERIIAVIFSDHCFTRREEPGDDPELHYPGSDRRPGCFSIDRYVHSL